jgi:cation diffusion facilitator CzcD-associated flavoprotein CzcO
MSAQAGGSHRAIESHAVPEVAIIGAGFSGIGVASSLDCAGMHDYLIVAQGDGFAEGCARRFGLHDKARFGCKIISATFDESAHRWALETDQGDTIDARHVIDATGVLTQPKLPEIEGVERFAGVTLRLGLARVQAAARAVAA